MPHDDRVLLIRDEPVVVSFPCYVKRATTALHQHWDAAERRMVPCAGSLCVFCLEGERIVTYFNIPVLTEDGTKMLVANLKLYRALVRIAVSLRTNTLVRIERTRANHPMSSDYFVEVVR